MRRAGTFVEPGTSTCVEPCVGTTSGEPEASVPDRRHRILPEVVLVRRWVLGFWEFGGGRVGERVGTGEVSLQAT